MTIQSYIQDLCRHSGIDDDSYTIEVEEKEGMKNIVLNLPENESGLFIGYHGETLESLQRLLRIIFREELGEDRLILNINNYRDQRAESLQEKVGQIVTRIRETGESYTFPHLPSYDRFVIHSHISENSDYDDLESFSEGEKNQRLLTIRLKK